MARIIFRGPPSSCAVLLPFAQHKLVITTQQRRKLGTSELTNRYSFPSGRRVVVRSAVSGDSIFITAGLLQYEFYGEDTIPLLAEVYGAEGAATQLALAALTVLDQDYPGYAPNAWYCDGSYVVGGVGPRYYDGLNGGVPIQALIERPARITSQLGSVVGPVGSEVTGAAIQGDFCVGVSADGTVKAWRVDDPTSYAEAKLTLPSWVNADHVTYPGFWCFNRTATQAVAKYAAVGGSPGIVWAVIEVTANGESGPPVINAYVAFSDQIQGLLAVDFNWMSSTNELIFAYASSTGEEYSGGYVRNSTLYFVMRSVVEGEKLRLPTQVRVDTQQSPDFDWGSKIVSIDLRYQAYLVCSFTSLTSPFVPSKGTRIYAGAFGQSPLEYRDATYPDMPEYSVGGGLGATAELEQGTRVCRRTHPYSINVCPDTDERAWAAFYTEASRFDGGDIELDAITTDGVLVTHEALRVTAKLLEKPVGYDRMNSGAWVVL